MTTAPDHQLPGFDEARRLMSSHEARARVYERLGETDFLAAPSIVAVHVDDAARVDRAFLTAFGRSGRRVDVDTLYVDDPTQRLEVAAEFDHAYTGMVVPMGSDLERAVLCETGWIVDLAAVRAYDLLADRQATQRAAMLAHLGDMMNSGQARGFVLGSFDDDVATA